MSVDPDAAVSWGEGPTQVTVICRTPGCFNAGQAIRLVVDDPDVAVACGVCGRPITPPGG